MSHVISLLPTIQISRDLKPENILLNESMHIQITDFGTAKIIEEGGDGEWHIEVLYFDGYSHCWRKP